MLAQGVRILMSTTPRGTKLYFIKASLTLESGNRLTYGQQGEVMGPATGSRRTQGQGLSMKFPGNQQPVGCLCDELSKSEPPPLPEGFRIGQTLLFIGKNETMASGKRLIYGQLGQVVGPGKLSARTKGEGLLMKFKGNDGNLGCLLSELSNEAFVAALAEASVAFEAKKVDAAIQILTAAIAVNKNHFLLSARSVLNAEKKAFEEALLDADKCIEIKPTWSRGYLRRGIAFSGLKKWTDALASFKEGLRHDPSSQKLKDEVRNVSKVIEAKAEEQFQLKYNRWTQTWSSSTVKMQQVLAAKANIREEVRHCSCYSSTDANMILVQARASLTSCITRCGR